MTLLFDRRGDALSVTKEIVKAAAGNWKIGTEMITLLFNRHGDTLSVTKEIVKAAAGNWKIRTEIMTLLFDRHRDALPITEEVVKAAARNLEIGTEIMTLLFNRRGDALPVTKELIKAVITYDFGKGVIVLLSNARWIETESAVSTIKSIMETLALGKTSLTLPCKLPEDIPNILSKMTTEFEQFTYSLCRIKIRRTWVYIKSQLPRG